jgi:hypothetical protein
LQRIEIRQYWRFAHHIGENLEWTVVSLYAPYLTPPMLAYTFASAPVFFVGDLAMFLAPAKVYEIVQ